MEIELIEEGAILKMLEIEERIKLQVELLKILEDEELYWFKGVMEHGS